MLYSGGLPIVRVFASPKTPALVRAPELMGMGLGLQRGELALKKKRFKQRLLHDRGRDTNWRPSYNARSRKVRAQHVPTRAAGRSRYS